MFRHVIAGLFLGLGIEGAVCAATFPLPPPGTDVVGGVKVIYAKRRDTLLDIARRYDLGYNEITEANPGIDPWLPGEGARIVVPTRFVLPDAPREGVVVDLAGMRLFYYPVPQGGKRPVVITYPIGIGRVNWQTPVGATRIVSKEVDPVWHIPQSIAEEHLQQGDALPKAVPAGPDNPLGKYALRLGFASYLIHGTNTPYAVGRRASHGCLRLYPEDIAELFLQVDTGTRVEIVDQPYLAGWLNGDLYLQAHRPLAETRKAFTDNVGVAYGVLQKQTRARPVPIDWDKAAAVVLQARSVPIRVSASPGHPAAAQSAVQSAAAAQSAAGTPTGAD